MLTEYDFSKIQGRSMGPERTRFGNVIRLDVDVAAFFKTAESVNTILGV